MKPGGAIVNISSVHALQTAPLVAPYAAAKAALLSLTRPLPWRAEPRHPHQRHPAGRHRHADAVRKPDVKSGAEHIAPSEVGKPADIAAAVAFLASDDAAFVQGTGLIVDGGRLSRL